MARPPPVPSSRFRLAWASRPRGWQIQVGVPVAILIAVSGLFAPSAGPTLCSASCAASLPHVGGPVARGGPPGLRAPEPLPPPAAGAGNVRFGPVIGRPDPQLFWALEGHMPSGAPDSRLAALMNATPFASYRFAAGVDETNQTAGVTYSDDGRAGPSVLDARQLATWCGWVRCRANWGLPAETGDIGAAAATVRYVEGTLHFRPAFWSIGNEPWGWTHYGIPWADWKTTDRSACSAACYARLVERMVPALRQVDPSIRIIGIQNSDCFNSSYLQAVAALDASWVNALACHVYPLASNSHPSLSQFFASLSGPNGLAAVVPQARAAVAFGCRCAIPVFVDEYNAFVISGLNPLMRGYAEVPWMAASTVEALDLNLTQFEYYALQDTGAASDYDLVGPGDAPAPIYSLYHTVLSNLFLGEVLATSVRTSVPGVFSVETVVPAGNHHSVLVVNTNLSRSVRVDLAGSGFPLAGAGMSWLWTPSLTAPRVAIYSAGHLPADWSIPPESLVLVNSA